MIKFFDDSNKIIPLWQEAFGDSKEDNPFFLKNARKNMIEVYWEYRSYHGI